MLHVGLREAEPLQLVVPRLSQDGEPQELGRREEGPHQGAAVLGVADGLGAADAVAVLVLGQVEVLLVLRLNVVGQDVFEAPA